MGQNCTKNSQKSSNSNNALTIPAKFLYEELPIRFTRSVKILTSEFPQEMQSLPAVKNMAYRYLQDIKTLIEAPNPTTPQNEEKFTDVLRLVSARHRETMAGLGIAFQELINSRAKENLSPPQPMVDETGVVSDEEKVFDRFYRVNLGARLLMCKFYL